jgi:tRNA_anti-like
MAMTNCKECEQRISDLAASCPNCGAPTDTPQPKQSARGLRILLPALALGCLAIAGWLALSSRGREELATLSGRGRQQERSAPAAVAVVTPVTNAVPSVATITSPAPSVAIYETTAEQLYQDYSANAVAAQDRIGGRRIRVRGMVSAIDEDSAEHAVVRLWTSPGTSLEFQLDDDQKGAAAQLTKGESVSIECSHVRLGTTSPRASNCSLALFGAGPRTSYLAVVFSEAHGQLPLYVVGPISESVCAEQGEHISSQLAAGGQIVSKQCAATAQESLPHGEDCRLDSSMSAVPDFPTAHLWRYNCAMRGAALGKSNNEKKTSHKAVPATVVASAEPETSVAPKETPDPKAVPVSTPAATPAVAATPAESSANPAPVVAALPADLATVSAKDPDAANRINSYCNKVTATASNSESASQGCRREEVAAWNRFTVQNEFPTLDDAARRKCSEPPFPDSYVAKEACAKYQLRLN